MKIELTDEQLGMALFFTDLRIARCAEIAGESMPENRQYWEGKRNEAIEFREHLHLERQRNHTESQP